MSPPQQYNPPPDSGAGASEYFVINVSGVKFEATLGTLTTVSGSRLAELATRRKDDPSYRPLHDDFFFERHAGAFDIVLHFHRTGKLHVGGGLCGDLLKQELKFWNVEDSFIEQCCWDTYIESVERPSDFSKLESHFQSVGDTLKKHGETLDDASRLAHWSRTLAIAFDHPSSSALGKCFLFLCAALTATSIGIVLAEPHFLESTLEPEWVDQQHDEGPDGSSLLTGNTTERPKAAEPSLARTTDAAQAYTRSAANVAVTLFNMDLAVYVYFFLEFFLRLAVVPYRLRFLASGQCIADIACLAGQTARIIERYLPRQSAPTGEPYGAIRRFVRCLGVLQLLRVARLLRHSDMARVLVYTLVTSLHELSVVVTFMIAFVVAFACLAHYADTKTFPTILHGCWWSVVTLTTVGYGDVTPKTPWGYVVGSLCALGGTFILAFTVPVVVSNFNVYYSHVRGRKLWKQKCERAQRAKTFWKDLPLVSKSLLNQPAAGKAALPVRPGKELTKASASGDVDQSSL